MNIIYYLLQLVEFKVLLVWFVLLPGLFVVTRSQFKISKLEKLILALDVGVVVSTFLLFIFSTLQLKNLSFVLLSLFNFYYLHSIKITKKGFFEIYISIFSEIKNNIWQLVLITFGALICGSLIFRSGWLASVGYQFTEFRDAMWHLGLMKELVKHVPPLHPGFAPESLSNYHYFSHLFGSLFLNFKFSDFDLYFRIFPFLLTFLFGVNVFLIGKTLIKKSAFLNLLIVLSYFSSSLAYLLPFYFGKNFNWHESSFWLSQPFTMVINPSFALSSSLLLASAYLIAKIDEKKNIFQYLIYIITFGTLIEFKVYAGTLALFALFIVSCYKFVKYKSFSYLFILFGSFFISGLIFLPTSQKAGSFMTFLPGWFLRSMIESPDRIQIIDWVLREETYLANGNMFGVLRLRFMELVIFLIGNLGIRIIGFLSVIYLFSKSDRNRVKIFYLSIIVLTGLVLPQIFVQNGSIANTLQFSYYSLILLTILLVYFLERVFKQLTNKLFLTFIFLLFVSLGIPTSIKHFIDTYYVKEYYVVSVNEVKALKYIEGNSFENDIILTSATPKFTTSLFLSVFSNRRFYYSDRLMAENTLKDAKGRESKINNFFTSHDKGGNTSFLHDNSVKYIYLDKNEVKTFVEDFYPVQQVFGNKDVIVYKVL